MLRKLTCHIRMGTQPPGTRMGSDLNTYLHFAVTSAKEESGQLPVEHYCVDWYGATQHGSIQYLIAVHIAGGDSI